MLFTKIKYVKYGNNLKRDAVYVFLVTFLSILSIVCFIYGFISQNRGKYAFWTQLGLKIPP